jgi:SnoaL-like protein
MQPHPVAADLAAAVARRDPQRLVETLTETVRMRALLPAAAIVAHGRADVAACFYGWFADFDTVEVLESAAEDVGDRLLIHYRFGVSQGTTRWVCTQTAVCTVVDGRLAVINLLCSGFREVGHDDHVGTTPSGARLLG